MARFTESPVNAVKFLSARLEDQCKKNPSKEMNNAFVTVKILGSTVDLLVDSVACISFIDAGFVKKVFYDTTSPIIIPSTYPAVGTVCGELVPTILERSAQLCPLMEEISL